MAATQAFGQPFAPVAGDDTGIVTSQNTPVFIPILSNDTDSDGDLDPGTVDLDPGTADIQKTFSNASGTFEVDALGVVTFTPASGFSGNATITYTVSDLGGLVSNAASIQVYVDRSPTATNDATTTPEDQPATINILANDDDESLNAASVDLDPGTPPQDKQIQVTGGLFAVDNNGVVTFTPDDDYSGVAQASYNVADTRGQVSNTATITVTVSPVNDPPSIVNQSPISINEDTEFILEVSHLTITDPDPGETFTIFSIGAGANYTVDQNKIIPNPNYNGSLTVPVVVSDGEAQSASFNFMITVTPVNDPPTITGPPNITIGEGSSLALTVSDLVISDPDANESFTIFSIGAGANYTVDNVNKIITPNPNYSGSLTVPVVVADQGGAQSPVFNLSITVTGVNDPPSITGQQVVSIDEDTDFTLNISHLIISDPDPGETFTIASIGNGANYTVGPGNTITPNPNYSGSLTVPVTVSDGEAQSEIFNFVITVNPVPDPPNITGQVLVEVNEDTPLTIAVAHLIISDPDDNETFTIASVGAGSNYTVGAGNTITPSSNYNGGLSVPVVVADKSGLQSASFNLSVTVKPVNDPPSITGQVPVTINEDAQLVISISHLIISDPDANETFAIASVGTGSNYTVGAGNTITPNANYSGPLSIPVVVRDNAGALSSSFNLAVTVTAVNDPPSITGQQTVSVNEDNSLTITTAHLIISDPDPGETFTIASVGTGANYTVSGNVITPNANYSGPLSVPVVVADKAGALSAPFTLAVTVNPVNDIPVITAQSAASIPEEGSFTITLSHITVVDPDNTSFTLFVFDGVNYTRSNNIITPNANFTGDLLVPIQVSDGTANSTLFNFRITVTPVNDPPTITGQVKLQTPEDTQFQILPSHLIISDPDNTSGFTVLVTDGPNYSIVSGTTILPDQNFNGKLEVEVRVSDGTDTSAPFSLEIDVTPVNDPPVITAQALAISIPEEGQITLQLSDLTFSDPDNTSGFTLLVSAGSNYTVSGTTITAATNFNGDLTVPVRISDGSATSAPFNVIIKVTPVNDPPVITGQLPLSTQEDRAIGLAFSDLIVSDPDNTYPAGFSIQILSGTNYTVSNGEILPSQDFNGTLTVPVIVNDGIANSNQFALKITVTPVNDPPTIVGQSQISVNEDQSFNVLVSHVIISDPDNTSGFTISVLSGTNYTATGNTVQPAANFNGILNVRVQVSDGSATSNTYNLQVTVNPVNDPPVITGQVAVSTNEDQPLEILLEHLIVTDPDNSYPIGFTLHITGGPNYTFSGNTITPALNFNGTLSVNVRVNDGQLNSATFPLQVTVNPVNDEPKITGQTTVTTPEETPITIQPSHLIISDPDNTSGFTVTVADGDNYTRSGNTITPVKDFNGTLTVKVQVRDPGLLVSDVFDLKVQVTPVNDPPVIIGQKILSTDEDVPITIKASDLTIVDPDNTTFTVVILAGTNYTFSGATVTPALDFNGTLNVNVRVSDGTAQSPTFVVQVQVGDANDPPVITGQSQLSVNEDASITLRLEHFTVTDPDNTYPADFTLNINQGSNYTVSNNTVTPNPNFFGVLTVPVSVNDGVNNSALFNAQITVVGINDAPSFNQIPNQQVAENSGQHVVTIQNISAGPFESAQSVVLIATSSNSSIIADPEISYDGKAVSADLTYTVKPNVSGIVTITVRAVDNGNPALTFTSTFQIEVSDVNAAPTLDVIPNVVVQEDSPTREVALTGISAGVGETQPLTVTVTTDKPELFNPAPTVVYQSPNPTGTLRITPKANAFGTATITVTVTDNGSNTPPSVNRITRSFTFTIESVNDVPVITSTPPTSAVVGETYTYDITSTDIENEPITYSFPVKPAWLAFTPVGTMNGRLSGSPPLGGQHPVTVVATDGSGGSVTQQFVISANTRPALTSVAATTPEDQPVAVPVQSMYSDADGDAIAELKFTVMPKNGRIMVGNTPVTIQTPVPASAIATLMYHPDQDFNGKDTVRLSVSDGKNYSSQDAYVAFTINPLNDPPIVATIEGDSLFFEVDGEAELITSTFVAYDPDDEIIAGADIAFARATYRRDDDVLIFENTTKITGTFDPAAGVLILTGEATTQEYTDAIRTVKYNYLETVDPVLERKILTITLTDGKAIGPPKERYIMLTYSFEDLEIPSGFTPNGDNVNDKWIIAPPDSELQNAEIKVYNHRGIKVYEGKGFNDPWDGTCNGERVPAGTYFYTIDLKLKNKKTYKGTVTVLY